MNNEFRENGAKIPESVKIAEKLTTAQSQGPNTLLSLIENLRILELSSLGSSKLLDSLLIGNVEIKLNQGGLVSPMEIMFIAIEIDSVFTQNK